MPITETFLISRRNFTLAAAHDSALIICDIMGQNQSHVAKYKRAEIYILSENVKICQFIVFIKNKMFV